MMHLKRLGNDLTAWAQAESGVRALLWFGSMARGDANAHSDLDAAVVLGPHIEPSKVVRSCASWFGARLRMESHIRSRSEATLWVDDVMTKVDLQLVNAIEGLAWLADSPDIVPPRLVAVLDKDGVCGPITIRAAQRIDRDLVPIVDDEIEKFLVAFEACSAAHRRSDGYQFYFHYNLALHRLARLVEISRGQAAYLFLPKLLLPRRMTLQEQVHWRGLRGTIYLPEATEAKRRLATAFVGTIDELAHRINYSRQASELRRWLEAVILRDVCRDDEAVETESERWSSHNS